MMHLPRWLVSAVALLVGMYFVLLTAVMLSMSRRIDGLEDRVPVPICPMPPTEKLRQLLGRHFNEQFMRVEQPDGTLDIIMPDVELVESAPPVRSREPFGRFVRHAEFGRPRIDLPWHCKTEDRWLRLPVDYFPPFLNSRTCSHATCFSGLYDCAPGRPVNVFVLRDKRDRVRCRPASQLRYRFRRWKTTLWPHYYSARMGANFHLLVWNFGLGYDNCERPRRTEFGWLGAGAVSDHITLRLCRMNFVQQTFNRARHANIFGIFKREQKA